jgi:hypothetical protein
LISTVETLILGEGIKGFRIVVVLRFVWGKDTPFSQPTPHLPKGKQYGSSRQGMKSWFQLKKNILWDMTYLIPHLVPSQFQESSFPQKPSINIG